MASQIEREGVVRDEKTGELIIPASQRPDGTWRKARRVKDGYIPQEEVPIFESKGTQWLKSRPTHPIGLSPEDVEKMEQTKKMLADPKPAQPMHTSKAAKKNAKRKEKKRQDAKSSVTKCIEQVTITAKSCSSNPESEDLKPDLAKKLKNLKKKLKQIEELENKIKSGELKNPEKDQLEKISRKKAILEEIEDLELELEESS
ncbi:partner of Y14 and mago-like [Pomacea canaliculata]|uniref:partner of Y14 and mago-like n=1 Tax=Pomacea canaliculata TaxID=400727 RepID=UPI000D736602|nr:partner of Y14 and mago-like [Pomacea canaliculata]